MKPSYEELEQKLAVSQREFRAADATIENLQMQVEKLAAENAGLKAKGRELLGEACAVYEKLNKMIDPAIGDFIDGQTLHEFQFVLDCETPQTNAFLAEVRASAFNDLCAEFVKHKALAGLDDRQKVTVFEATEALLHCAEQLDTQFRKGVQS
ncbi:hypothetical protein ACSIFQ_004727 [Enterobacter hormaechei]